MNNGNNINLSPECSYLLESPPLRHKETLLVYGECGWTSNYQQEQYQQQWAPKWPPPPPAATSNNLVSPSTPDKPSAHIMSSSEWTLKHANTTPTLTTQYYSPQQRTKKSVHFATTATVHPINMPIASEMTRGEKEIVWYREKDYNHFKHDAASDGGVKIARRFSVETQKMGNCCHFVLIGSFDGDCDEDNTSSSSNSGSNHSSDAATAGSIRSSPSGKFYNENEYNDCVSENGQEVCKRGLGYHFSRIRKRNRATTRNAVLAWQTCLQKESNKKRIEQVFQRKMQASPFPSINTNSLPSLKTQAHFVIALVSTKCSRVSREEALWRGNIDFRVAYPERCLPDKAHCDNGFNESVLRKRSRVHSSSRTDGDGLYHSKRRRSAEV